MHAAALVGRRFSVVTTLGRTRARARELADRYGFREACVAVRACEVPVLALEERGARARLVDECRRAVRQDGADAIVLGCAGMAALCAAIADEVGVPVVDGVAAATVLAQSLVALGLRPGGAGSTRRRRSSRWPGCSRVSRSARRRPWP